MEQNAMKIGLYVGNIGFKIEVSKLFQRVE